MYKKKKLQQVQPTFFVFIEYWRNQIEAGVIIRTEEMSSVIIYISTN